MSGFAGVSKRRRGREFEEFPELLAYLMRRFPNPTKSQQGAPEAQADIKYRRPQADHRRDRAASTRSPTSSARSPSGS